MDSMTEQIVFERLFGLEGLLRQNGITTILATHAGKQLSHYTLSSLDLKTFSSEPFTVGGPCHRPGNQWRNC